MIINRNKLVTLLSMCSIPLLALIPIVVEVANKRRYALYCLALMMAIFAIYILPVADLYRHTLTYYELREYDLDTFLDFLKVRQDVIFYIVLYAFGTWGINFEFVRFLSVFIGYSAFFTIFFDCIQRFSFLDRKKYLLLFFAFFFYVPFLDLGNGIRFFLASSILALSCYQLYVLHRNLKGYLLGILACMIHFGQFPLFFLVILLRNQFLARYKYFYLCLCLVLIGLGPSIVIMFIESLPLSDVYKYVLLVYTEGAINSEKVSNTLLTKIFAYFSHITFVLSIFYLFILKEKTRLLNLAIGILLFRSLFSAFPIANRYEFFFSFVVLLTYIEHDFRLQRAVWYLKLFMIFSLLIFSLRFYSYRMMLPAYRVKEYFLTPSVASLFHSDPPEKVFRNVDEDGTLVGVF